jgi:hypothetical protein
VVSRLYYSSHTGQLVRTYGSAVYRTHKFAVRAAASLYESYTEREHRVEAGLARDHGLHRLSLFSRSARYALMSGERVHLPMLAFSNFQRRLQEAIFALNKLLTKD